MRKTTRNGDKNFEALRMEVWRKAIGNGSIAKGNHYYDKISKAIFQETEYSLSKDTIRNFFEDKHSPSPKTLDIYSTYVLGYDKDSPKTYSDFQTWSSTKSTRYNRSIFLKSDRHRYLIIFFALVIIIFLVSLVLAKQKPERKVIETEDPQKTIEFSTRFYSSNTTTLENKGWEIKNKDLSKWDTLHDVDALVLNTHLGDSWLVNPEYEPIVYNILRRNISCGDCCEIKVKLVNFNPYQKYQQAGIFLYYTENAFPSIRMTRTRGGVQVVDRKTKYVNNDPFKHESFKKNRNFSEKVDSLILQIRIERNTYFFGRKLNDDEFAPISSIEINRNVPIAIGLAAFQGRPDIPSPRLPVADTIPAYFEYIKIINCEN